MARFQQREGVGAQQVAKLYRGAFRRGRRMRQRQAINGQRHRTERRNRENPCGIGNPRHADKDTGDDPADGAEDAHHREGFIDVRQTVESDVIGQRQRRHIAQSVAEQQANQQRAVLRHQRLRNKPQNHRPGQVHYRHHLLRSEKAVDQHAQYEWRKNGRNRPGGESIADQQRHLIAGHHQPQRDRPASPNKELHKHH